MEQQKSAVMEGDAPPKQVALAIERLGKASRLFAEIRLGVDRLLEVVIDLSEQETKTALDLIVKGDSSIRCHFQDLLILGIMPESKKMVLPLLFFNSLPLP